MVIDLLESDTEEEIDLEGSATIDEEQDNVKQKEDPETLQMITTKLLPSNEEATDIVVSTRDRQEDAKDPPPPPRLVIDVDADTEDMDLEEGSATVDEKREGAKQEKDFKTLKTKKDTNTVVSSEEDIEAKVPPPPPPNVSDGDRASSASTLTDQEEEEEIKDMDVVQARQVLPLYFRLLYSQYWIPDQQNVEDRAGDDEDDALRML